MKIWLIDDEEKFMRALARTKHSEIFKSEDDRALQERMRKENDALVKQGFADFMHEIHKNKPSKDLINWEYLRVHKPKRYQIELKKRQKQLLKERMDKEIA